MMSRTAAGYKKSFLLLMEAVDDLLTAPTSQMASRIVALAGVWDELRRSDKDAVQ